MNQMPNFGVKDAVNAVVLSLPDDVSWDEVHYRLYVRQQIEAGLADSEGDRVIDTAEMRKRLADRKPHAQSK